MSKFSKKFTNRETAKTLNDFVEYEIIIIKNEKCFLFEDDLFESLDELTEYLIERYLIERTESQKALNAQIISEINAFFTETSTETSEYEIVSQNSEIIAVQEQSEYNNTIVHFVKKFEDVSDINKRVASICYDDKEIIVNSENATNVNVHASFLTQEKTLADFYYFVKNIDNFYKAYNKIA